MNVVTKNWSQVMKRLQTEERKDAKASDDEPTVLPDVSDEVVPSFLEQCDDVLVERILVLEQPFVARIIHLPCVMDQTETGLLPEVWFLKLEVSGVLHRQLVHQGFVGGLWKPTLLIEESQDAHGL